jgi:hypothetical protein
MKRNKNSSKLFVLLLLLLLLFTSWWWWLSSASQNDSNQPLLSAGSSSSSTHRTHQKQRRHQQHEHNNNTFKMLYVMTSSSKTYRKEYGRRHVNNTGTLDRLKDMIFPILQHNIESFYDNNNNNDNNDILSYLQKQSPVIERIQVDLFMITSYSINQTELQQLRTSLPYNTGLELWQQAQPLSYSCKEYDSRLVPVMRGRNCKHYRSNEKGRKYDSPFNETRLFTGYAQLAREHRYVIKDKLPYYDFFVVLEDDMVYTSQHVLQYIKLNNLRVEQIRKEKHLLIQKMKNMKNDPPKQQQSKSAIFRQLHIIEMSETTKWNTDLELEVLEQMRPGFIRTEVVEERFPLQLRQQLQDRSRQILQIKQKQKESKLFKDDEPDQDGTIDVSGCCDLPKHIATQMSKSVLHPHPRLEDVIVWETNTNGLNVRPWTAISKTNSNSWWIAATMIGSLKFPSYWAGEVFSLNKGRGPADPKLIAQSAGWMGHAFDVLDFDTNHCSGMGGFLPPFDGHPYQFALDGLWKHNVEFWSGGVQLWDWCHIQRYFSLESAREFSNHLVYHSSNNKQYAKTDRLVPIQTLWDELMFAKQQGITQLTVSKMSK